MARVTSLTADKIMALIGALNNIKVGTGPGDAKAGDWKPGLDDLPAGSLIVFPRNGTINTSATAVRPTARTDIFVRWRSTVQPNNMIAGDEWYDAS